MANLEYFVKPQLSFEFVGHNMLLFLLDSEWASEHKCSYSKPFALAECQSGTSGQGKQDNVYGERGKKCAPAEKGFFIFEYVYPCFPSEE